MGAVAVAQQLHATVAVFSYNNVTGGIERDARGIMELAGAFSFAADGADMRAVAVAQHLHTMVVIVGNNKVAFAVKRNTAVASSELPVAAALAADGADVGAVAQPMHLHTSVVTVKYSNVALAVDGDAPGTSELSVASAFAADGANMGAVAVAQHLHAMVATVGNNKVAFAVKRNTAIAIAKAYCELPVAAALAADGADVGAVAQPMHLHTSVATVKYSNVALAVDGNAPGIVELSIA